ncbi:MFS transporter [Tissierella sp. MSJ-40]|uniref:MFS transporter n=1 Tax=Tissierella simiarum TaxID=2841534 RepID=A0ABS6E297_9FIRM|nr:MFS transporter [Tissierella simiarum]MBU5437025.1 MFS transporter [Tissierella simiarum]
MDELKRKRLLMMISGAFIISFTGFPHMWSIYQPYIIKEIGWSVGPSTISFYLAIVFFVIGNIIGGRIQDKFSPRIVIFIGGVLFSSGLFLCTTVTSNFPMAMYIYYGIMQGFGTGAIYTSVITSAQKWFPDRTGFASGVIIASNGLAGFFIAPFSKYMLQTYGVNSAFTVFSIIITIAWILAFIFVKNPHSGYIEEFSNVKGLNKETKLHILDKKQYTTKEMLRSKRYYLLAASMMCSLLAYFTISPISQILQMSRNVPENIAVMAIMIGSLANASARLIIPTLSDKIGRIKCLFFLVFVSLVSTGLLIVPGSYTTTIAIIAIYFCYGGILGIYPALTTALFGVKHGGENYGYVMIGLGIASVLSPILSAIIPIDLLNGKGLFMLIGIVESISIILVKKLQKELNIII